MAMKKNYLRFGLIFFFLLTLVTACKKDDDDNNDDNNNNITPVEHKYTASASYGDIIRYTFDVANNTYSFTNETTGETGSGSFTMSSNPNLTGVYEITANSNIYYVIELAEKVFATSDPSGRPENKLTFGISADLDLSTSYTAADIAGKYLYLTYSDFFNDSTDWGGFELFADGTYSYNFGPNYVEDFDDVNQFTGAGSGTWVISSTDHSRIIFTEGGTDYTGTVYPEKVLMIDNGVGNGFSLGIKYPATHATQSSVAGTYRFLDITSTGETGVGYYTIPASGGTLSYYYKYPGASGEGSGSCSDFTATPTVQNMFEASEVIESVTYTTYFIILPGEVMLHFCMDPNGAISYGLGAKIN
jgi:hypothetical protein